jgi:ATP-binding protein involved in chromosome partitioning
MCKKVNIPVLGVVENMSYFVDTAGVRHEIFGKGGGQAVADFAEAPLLGQVAIDQKVREAGDAGIPIVQGLPESAAALSFVKIAEALVERAEQSAEANAPPVVIDRSGGTGKKKLPVVK